MAYVGKSPYYRTPFLKAAFVLEHRVLERVSVRMRSESSKRTPIKKTERDLGKIEKKKLMQNERKIEVSILSSKNRTSKTNAALVYSKRKCVLLESCFDRHLQLKDQSMLLGRLHPAVHAWLFSIYLLGHISSQIGLEIIMLFVNFQSMPFEDARKKI